MTFHINEDQERTRTQFFEGVKGQSNWRKDTIKQKHIGSDGYLVMPTEEAWFNRQNKYLRVTVMTFRVDEGYGKYHFIFSESGDTITQKPFKRKINALKYAKNWMKSHPRG